MVNELRVIGVACKPNVRKARACLQSNKMDDDGVVTATKLTDLQLGSLNDIISDPRYRHYLTRSSDGTWVGIVCWGPIGDSLFNRTRAYAMVYHVETGAEHYLGEVLSIKFHQSGGRTVLIISTQEVSRDLVRFG